MKYYTSEFVEKSREYDSNFFGNIKRTMGHVFHEADIGWRYIEDELPEDDRDVLIVNIHNDKVYTGYYMEGYGWYMYETSGSASARVSQWFKHPEPLPEREKEEKKPNNGLNDVAKLLDEAVTKLKSLSTND